MTTVAEALRKVGDLNPQSEQMGAEVWAGPFHRDEFSVVMLRELQELIWAVPDLEQASVKVAGRRKPVNLKRGRISSPVPVALVDKKQVGLPEAAEVLFAAYEQ